jgi:hypothetical protein
MGRMSDAKLLDSARLDLCILDRARASRQAAVYEMLIRAVRRRVPDAGESLRR